jgi:hypothetical protein
MSNWGGLNNALAAWRNGVNDLFPNRSTRSDGARADGNHASTSEHQPDADGTVDAFDEDRNFLGSTDQDGNAAEDRILFALNADFMADPRAHLIISDRKIRNDQIGHWQIRNYGGSSPHTEHTHRQVHQSKEDDGRAWKFTHTRALLRQMEDTDMPTPKDLLDFDDVPNPYGDSATNPNITVRTALKAAAQGEATSRDTAAAVKALRGEVATLKSALGSVQEALALILEKVSTGESGGAGGTGGTGTAAAKTGAAAAKTGTAAAGR